jgi:hypothetical protein
MITDEARSVLGIVIKDQPQRQQLRTPAHALYDEEQEYDHDGYASYQSEQKVTTQSPPPPSSSISAASVVQVSSSTIAYDDDADEESEEENRENEQLSLSKFGSSSTTTSTDTSSLSSPSTSTTSPVEEVSSYSPPPSSSSSTTEGPTSSSTTAAYLKARLRPNKKLLASLQPKLSPVQQRDKNESTRHTNLSKLLKFRTSSSTYSPISNSKMFTMATEDPSLPLEAMFSNVNKS